MENYRTRMLFELLDLTVRIEKLESKLSKPTERTEHYNELLERQFKYMMEYKNALLERLVMDLEGEN